MKEAVRRQQELNELCRRNTAQKEMRQRRKYDFKNDSGKAICCGTIYLGVLERHTFKRDKKLLKKWRGPFMITEVHQQGRFYRLSIGRTLHYENLKPHVLSPEDCCVPQNMEGLEYLLVEPACEVNEKGTREKNDGNEVMSMDDNEKMEVGSHEGSFAEEDWNLPDLDKVPKWTDQSATKKTRRGGRKKTIMRYKRYGDDFLIDKTQPEELGAEMVNVDELTADEEWQIIEDGEHSLQEDRTTPEKEMNLEQSETERRRYTNLRILEWMHNLEADEKEAQSIQHVDMFAAKHVKAGNQLFGWTTTDRPMDIPPENLSPAPSTGTSIIIFVRRLG